MTKLTILYNQTDSKTLEQLIKETRAALDSMPPVLSKDAEADLVGALATPSFMMIAGNPDEQEQGFRLYWLTLADFLENYDLWYNCLKASAAPPVLT
jgi:hypothetical protein